MYLNLFVVQSYLGTGLDCHSSYSVLQGSNGEENPSLLSCSDSASGSVEDIRSHLPNTTHHMQVGRLGRGGERKEPLLHPLFTDESTWLCTQWRVSCSTKKSKLSYSPTRPRGQLERNCDSETVSSLPLLPDLLIMY